MCLCFKVTEVTESQQMNEKKNLVFYLEAYGQLHFLAGNYQLMDTLLDGDNTHCISS